MSGKSHSAEGSIAGFEYQFVRALHLLSHSMPGCEIGIETEDDVVTKDSGGKLTLEQDKHSLQSGGTHPFVDGSHALWNTMKIWSEYLKATSNEDVKFLFSTNKTVSQGFVLRLASANTPDDVDACVSEMHKLSPSIHKKALPAYGVVSQLSADILCRLIGNIQLFHGGDGSNYESLKKETIANLKLPSNLADQDESIYNELTGWLKHLCMNHWYNKTPATISAQSFINQIDVIAETRKRQRFRVRCETLIAVTDSDRSKERSKTFVNQLNIVNVDDDDLHVAIDDYLKYRTEALRLSSEGELTPRDWIALNHELKRRWQDISKRVLRTNSKDSPEDQGLQIFDVTVRSDYNAVLAGVPIDSRYFKSGAYHTLSDDKALGWHPDYEKMV